MAASGRIRVFFYTGDYSPPTRRSFWIRLVDLMASERFAYIWQYTIEPTYREDFLAAYKPNGDWARLFCRDSSYVETVLLQDDSDENRYVTIDYWRSRADRDSFRERFSVEFDSLDVRCESFTREEHFLGDFIEALESCS